MTHGIIKDHPGSLLESTFSVFIVKQTLEMVMMMMMMMMMMMVRENQLFRTVVAYTLSLFVQVYYKSNFLYN